jgi:bacillolysin
MLPSDLPIEKAHNQHGRNSIDNKGMTLKSLVHFDISFDNAFWDIDNSQMVYGNGDGIKKGPYSLAADVVAHEMTHGVTDFSSKLIYQDESGKTKNASDSDSNAYLYH